MRGNFSGNSGEMLRHMALTGLGIARLGWFQVGEDVRLGKLVPLLEEFHAGELQGIYAVFFGRKYTAARVAASSTTWSRSWAARAHGWPPNT